MKKIVLFAVLGLLSTTSPAAAVESLVAMIASAMLPAGFAGVVTLGPTAIALTDALAVAFVATTVAVAAMFKQGVDPSKAKETFEAADSAVLRGIGRVRVGGLKVFGNTSGLERYRVVAHLQGPVDAIESTWLGGREVIVEDDGAVSSPPYAKYGGSYVHIHDKPGDGTETAWTALVAAFPGLWTADHRLRGIFQSLVRYTSPGMTSRKFLRLYSGGVPDLERVVRVERIHDPRDPAQDPDDASTWTWSDNGVLATVHVLRACWGLAAADFDWPRIAAEADRADEPVATVSGTEPRARAAGIWSEEEPRGDVVVKILDSIGGVLIDGDDGLRVALIDDERTSELTIPAKHVVSVEQVAGPESVERPNLCIVRYYAPERNYEMAEIDMTGIAWARVDDEIVATGVKPVTLDFPFCPSAAQAQRLARRKFSALRADRVAVTTNFAGLAAWGAQVITVETVDPVQSLRLAIEPPAIDDAAGVVEISGIVWPDLEAWDPETMEAAAPEQITDIPVDAALDQPAAPTAIEPIVYPDATKALRVAFAAAAGLTPECTVRTWSGSVPNAWVGMTEHGTSAYRWAEKVGFDAVGARADARVRVFDAEEESSNWSETTTVTSPALSAVAPARPGIGYDDARFVIVVTLANDLQVASVATTGAGSPGTVAGQPGVAIEWDPGSLPSGSHTFTARAYSSTGAASPLASTTVVI